MRLGRFPSRVKSVTAVTNSAARPQPPRPQAAGRSSTRQADSATLGASRSTPSAGRQRVSVRELVSELVPTDAAQLPAEPRSRLSCGGDGRGETEGNRWRG